MARNPKWHDDYWLLLMQIYLRKPVGVKPLYNRDMVKLSMELHIAPQELNAKMCAIANLKTPRIERIWKTYSRNPQRLSRAVRLWRSMKGFGDAGAFYEGVEVNETFEKDFKPLDTTPELTPAALILILDLYYRLTPITMVSKTPEVVEMAGLLKVRPTVVVDVLDTFQHCDPYLNRRDVTFSPLLLPCQHVWQRFGNGDIEELASFASQLKEYYR
jgi:hypothetical protein